MPDASKSAGVNVNVDLTAVDKKLAGIEAKARVLRPAFLEIRKPMIADQKLHARDEKGPNGSWPKRSAATEERRRRGNRRVRKESKSAKALATIALSPVRRKRRSRPKQLLGRLPAAFVIRVGVDAIKMISRAPWSGVHQEGGKVGRRKRVSLPRREFLWISEKLLATAEVIFARHILKGFK